MQSYVSILAVSPDLQKTVLLVKDRGPEQIIGKFSMVGGRVDPDDKSAAHAAARELKEECGVSTDPADLIPIFQKSTEKSQWNVFLAVTDISEAKTQPGESEQIHIVNFKDLREAAAAKDNRYAPDFPEILAAFDRSSVNEAKPKPQLKP